MTQFSSVINGIYIIFVSRDNKSCCPPINLVLKKLVIGLCLIAVVWLAPFGVPGGNHLSTKEFIETSQFCEAPWIIRFVYWSFWGQLILTKYVAIWILSEGAVILAGIGINVFQFEITNQNFVISI